MGMGDKPSEGSQIPSPFCLKPYSFFLVLLISLVHNPLVWYEFRCCVPSGCCLRALFLSLCFLNGLT